MMLKRQDSALSSSRRVMSSVPQPPNDHHHHAKSVGCMSGIFHLLSRHRHRRKFLTSGKKQEKVAQHDHRSSSHTIPKVSSSHESPTGQAEIKKSSVDNNINAISWEERRKLKFDLERCDEDLKELKMIIESIRYSDCERSPLPPTTSVVVTRTVVDERCGRTRRDDEDIKYSIVNEHTSPVSVLDELARAPLISTNCSRETTTKNGRMSVPQPQKGLPRKKDEATYESLFVQKVMIESVRAKREAVTSPLPRSSKAMIESVEEVCKDIAWGEKRDVGRIGLVIQDCICRDLIEEFVKDLGHSYKPSNLYSLPFQACKRKLCF
ncbi:uncharacterized protein LOC108224353 [Daucus carota subsp. sativus]|nr:PREDICTED: uncharacterized protein LOC108224353 [Daucus carota subsp. sativus]